MASINDPSQSKMQLPQINPQVNSSESAESPDQTQVIIETTEDMQLPEVSAAFSTVGPTLTVTTGPSAGLVFELDVKGTTTIGRDPSCSIFLNNMTVSRHHATITRKNAQLELLDEGSLNGTWLNGAIVSEAILQDGDVIQIGTFILHLRLNNGPALT